MSKTLAVRLSTILLVANAPVTMATAAKDARPVRSLPPAAAAAGHCEAWNTTDRVKRDILLRRVFASDGVYNDPTPTYVTGRVALSNEIARFQGQYPGARFRCSAPQTHHSAMRVSWLLLRRDGKVLEQGTDFYQLAPNGLIRRVTGFFGAPPPVSLSR
jgi:hypothetical protein